jgi:hypothetical protein
MAEAVSRLRETWDSLQDAALGPPGNLPALVV